MTSVEADFSAEPSNTLFMCLSGHMNFMYYLRFSLFCKTLISMLYMFWIPVTFQKSFYRRQVKWYQISSIKRILHKLSHEMSNKLKVRNLGKGQTEVGKRSGNSPQLFKHSKVMWKLHSCGKTSHLLKSSIDMEKLKSHGKCSQSQKSSTLKKHWTLMGKLIKHLNQFYRQIALYNNFTSIICYH